MVRSLSVFAVLAGLLVMVGVLATSCGGGEELTLEQYMRRLDGVLNGGRQRFEEADNPIEEGLVSEDSVEEAGDGFSDLAKVYREARDDLDGLNAPAEAQPGQTEMAGSLEHFADALKDVEDRAKGADSSEDIHELTSDVFGSEEATQAFGQFQGACRELQDVADRQGIEVELNCGRAIGAEPLSLEEYFTRLHGIFEEAKGKTEVVAKQLDQDAQAAKTLDEKKAAVERFLGDTAALFSGAIGGMEKLNPPEEPTSAHEAFLGAAEELVQRTSEFRIRLAAVTTDEEAKSVVTEFDDNTRDAIQRGDGACRDLQASAEKSGVAVDLKCAESG